MDALSSETGAEAGLFVFMPCSCRLRFLDGMRGRQERASNEDGLALDETMTGLLVRTCCIGYDLMLGIAVAFQFQLIIININCVMFH